MKANLKRTPSSVFGVTAALMLMIAMMTDQCAAQYGPTMSGFIDPATGLPVQNLEWKDPAWKDPEKTLADVTYDNIPVSDVAKHLQHEFKNAFDTIIPREWQDPNDPNRMLSPGDVSIKLQLKNVTASEVFNAMNVLFESENTPFRWELRLNGKRPTAVLRVLPHLAPPPPAQPPLPSKNRDVIFVGELLGDAKSGGMSIEQLVDTVSEVYKMSYGSVGDVLKFHKGAQLLIVTGTDDELQFVHQALSALSLKVQMEQRAQPAAVETKPNPDEKKSR